MGPLVNWIIGPLVHWSIGPFFYWSIGPLVQWSIGPLVHWSISSLVHRTIVPFFNWSIGPLVHRPLVYWSCPCSWGAPCRKCLNRTGRHHLCDWCPGSCCRWAPINHPMQMRSPKQSSSKSTWRTHEAQWQILGCGIIVVLFNALCFNLILSFVIVINIDKNKSIGPLAHWSIGPLVQWYIGPLVH